MVMTRKRAAADSCQFSSSQDKDTQSLDSSPHSNLNLLASSASSEAMSSGTSRNTEETALAGSSCPQGSAGPTSTSVPEAPGSTPQQAASQVSSKLSQTVIASPEPKSVIGSAAPPSGKFAEERVSFVFVSTAQSTAVNSIPSAAVYSVPSAVNIVPSAVNSVPSAGIIPPAVNIVQSAVNSVPSTAVNTIPSATINIVPPAAVNTVAANIVLPTAVSAVQSGTVSFMPVSGSSPFQASVSAAQGTASSAARSQTVVSGGAEKPTGIKQYKIVYRTPKSVSPGMAKPSSGPTAMGLNSVFPIKTNSAPSPAVPSAYTLCAAPSKDGGPPRQYLVPISGTMPPLVSSGTSLLGSTRVAIRPPKPPVMQSSGSLSTCSSGPVSVVVPLSVSAAVDSSASVLNAKDITIPSTTLAPVLPTLVPTSTDPADAQSMFQALFQLANTAKSHMTSNTQANTGKVDVMSNTQPGMDMSGHTQPSTAMSDMSGQVYVVSSGVPPLLASSSSASDNGSMLSTMPLHSMPSTPRHTVTSVPPTAPSPQNTMTHTPLLDGESVSWDRRSTLKLIELYKEHQVFLTDHHYKKKSVWELIARKLRQSIPDSPPFCWNHVENKWKNMTKKYRDCVDLNRRGVVTSKCSFFYEIAAVYNYPDEDQKKAAEGLRALKSATHRHSNQMAVNSNSDSVNQGSVCVQVQVTKMETASPPQEIPSSAVGHTSEIEPLLVKKKKYAHLDRQPASCILPSAAPRPILPRPKSISGAGDGGGVEGEKETGVDIVTLLDQLRGDRERQDQSRMERLEQMHKEKMGMFGKFLDILQQFKPS